MSEEEVCSRCGIEQDDCEEMFAYPCICNECLEREEDAA